VGAILWWDRTVASLGWALIAKCRPAHSKLRVEPWDPSEGLGFLGPKVGGHSVRLDLQSSENLPLPTVEG